MPLTFRRMRVLGQKASIPYAISKASLNHMTKMLAVTRAPEIGVNAIAPSLVDTPMTHAWQEVHDLWRAKSPMQRGASPMEIAEIALMLANSTYLTREVVRGDGGLNLT
ncbi:SDR family oxidoreductase [Sulfobacillus sp. hq2]|uniref:SDR family oxidoreductase n=1 Tax=Sulfobacillus TaxID=28033 RepID=UPI001A9A67F1|nr:SDR family oxidoreductase [Sulfobacillus sp. hq2]